MLPHKLILPEGCLTQHAGFCVSPPMLVLEFMEVRVAIIMLLTFAVQPVAHCHM